MTVQCTILILITDCLSKCNTISCCFLTGGLLFGIFGKRSNRFGRDPIVLFGAAVHWICFLLIFLNLPDKSPKYAIDATEVYHVFSKPK